MPQHMPEAVTLLQASVQQLRSLTDLLPRNPWPVRLTVDTNALIDNPDLAAYTGQIGPRYMAHLLPVVLRELDEKMRPGRTDVLREAAKKADRRLKGLRNNGDVTLGVRVAGDVHAVFEYIEPKSDALPDWLDLDVPDDRFIASTLLLQSQHPGSVWTGKPRFGPEAAYRTMPWLTSAVVRAAADRAAFGQLHGSRPWDDLRRDEQAEGGRGMQYIVHEDPVGRAESNHIAQADIGHSRSALDLLRWRLGQQRLDERPQFIRHDPRPRLTIPHAHINERSSGQSHDQPAFVRARKRASDQFSHRCG
ncbi:hypothetical protein [Streptomyces sviceus]|uniref:hypothetical protein n=1 Tax=Streptomyces sviceus TaxID=285530 RepID=UPI0036A28A8E